MSINLKESLFNAIDRLKKEEKRLLALKEDTLREIRDAEASGDLSENQQYHDAREFYTSLSRELSSLEVQLKKLDSAKISGVIEENSYVAIQIGEDEVFTGLIVPEVLSNFKEGFFNIKSPLIAKILGTDRGSLHVYNGHSMRVS